MPIRPLSPELQIKAEQELNEVPTRKQEDLQHIRDWLAKQPHLYVRTDDQWLLSFLRGCKFGLARTKEKLDMFYTVRSLVPEFFSNRDPFRPELQELLSLGTCIPLPKASDPTSKTTILIRHKSVNSEKIKVMDVLKVVLMTLDILINEDDNFIISGGVVIEDLKDIPITHLLQMTPGNAKKTMLCFQTAYPIRPKQITFLNASSHFESAFKIVKLFMNEKMRKRIYIYSDNYKDNLRQIVSPDILPMEYGGEAGSVDDMIVEWKKKVESYQEWFLEDAKYYSDEAKRPGKPKTSDEIFGVEGSFRKLEVD